MYVVEDRMVDGTTMSDTIYRDLVADLYDESPEIYGALEHYLEPLDDVLTDCKISCVTTPKLSRHVSKFFEEETYDEEFQHGLEKALRGISEITDVRRQKESYSRWDTYDVSDYPGHHLDAIRDAFEIVDEKDDISSENWSNFMERLAEGQGKKENSTDESASNSKDYFQSG